MVEVVVVQGCIVVGGQDFEDIVGQVQDGNVEGFVIQVVDGYQVFCVFVQVVGYGGGGWFVEQVQDVQFGQVCGIFGSLVLGVVEIGWYSDYCIYQFVIEGGFGVLVQFMQDVC